jgi:hypothetical protein
MLLCAVQRAETKQGRDSLSKVTERFQYIDGPVPNRGFVCGIVLIKTRTSAGMVGRPLRRPFFQVHNI